MFPSPRQLGLPRKFEEWREGQVQVIQDGLDTVSRWTVQKQQTGRGKTLCYMAQALIDRAHRYVMLTATKGLQDQLLGDFGGCGLNDLRGKSSYQCEGIANHTCAEGQIAGCCFKGSSLCGYNSAKSAATQERIVSTNYSAWVAHNKYGSGLGKFDVMVCDEAHSIPGELEKSMSVLLGNNEICEDLQRDWPAYKDRGDMKVWKHWALISGKIAKRELERLKIALDEAGKSKRSRMAKEYNHYQNLTRRLAEIANCDADAWVADEWNHGYKFDPIEPATYAERLLWRGIEKIILVSGTITPKTCEQSGVDLNDCKFYDYWSDLDPARSPVMYIPTTKVNHYSQPWQLRKLVERIDQIVEGRQDRKGIVHTSNGKLRDFIISNSRYARHMVSNYSNKGDITHEVIERFKRMPAPALLVSPSVTTGYDFPYDACRYQVVAKLNYPGQGSEVEKERFRLDPDRGSHHAVVSLQQAIGRGFRSDDDFQEVFILDDAYPALAWYHGGLFNPSLLAIIKKVDRVPKAPRIGGRAA